MDVFHQKNAKSSPIAAELPPVMSLLVTNLLPSPTAHYDHPEGGDCVQSHLCPQCLAWGLALTKEVLGGMLAGSPVLGAKKPRLQF